MKFSHFVTGSALLDLVGGLLTLVAALIAARKENMPRIYVIVLFLASFVMLAGSWWGAAEQQHFQEFTTGGDGYAYLEFVDLGEGRYVWKIKHHGDYPIYDVEINIQSLSLMAKVDLNNQLEKMAASKDVDPIPTLTRDMTLSTPGYNPFLHNELKEQVEVFLITIHARNRSVHQIVTLQKVGERYKSAYMLFDKKPTLDDKPFVRHIEDGFPLNEKGEVDWHINIGDQPYMENQEGKI